MFKLRMYIQLSESNLHCFLCVRRVWLLLITTRMWSSQDQNTQMRSLSGRWMRKLYHVERLMEWVNKEHQFAALHVHSTLLLLFHFPIPVHSIWCLLSHSTYVDSIHQSHSLFSSSHALLTSSHQPYSIPFT